MSDDRGSAAVELVLVTPVLIALMLFVVAGGRLASSRADVDAAARDSARAASLARSSTMAERDGRAAAEATLSDQGVACRTLAVTIDTAQFRPGGTVAATVSCDVELADLTGLGLPGRRTISSRFVEPVDAFRGVTP
ncbi:MAG: TadE/TadG family type IV pilus assembly protein [Actinomycetota bacterium]|jgi:Flp pilus assembly protein TadG